MGEAFGAPGITPRWTHGDKEGIGTSYSFSSRVWFTIWNGIITETYYPTVDRPQMRDLQLLITDGDQFFHEEKRDLISEVERVIEGIPYYVVRESDPENRYSIEKEIICDPNLGVVLQKVTVRPSPDFTDPLHIYVLCAPHLEVGGAGNTGRVLRVSGKKILQAQKDGTYLALGCWPGLARGSCGYVGSSDGWSDISKNRKMAYEFDYAPDGNIALTGEIDTSGGYEFVIGLAFGNSSHSATTRLIQSISTPFEKNKEKYIKQWERGLSSIHDLSTAATDGGTLYKSSYAILLTHEDKTFEGALTASLSIPWGEAASDSNRGGYHLVWPRDMYNSSTAALAAGNVDLPFRTLIYLSVAQGQDGGFPQNFWINGEPYWHGMQLDETAFPIILAWRLNNRKCLGDFDPTDMISRAARYLIVNGPATQEDRWEEASGYSPSTLASNITALVCASDFMENNGDKASAKYLSEYADFLFNHLEKWTVTDNGTLVDGIKRHFIRLMPVDKDNPDPVEDLERLHINLANIKPGELSRFPAKEIVDGGFLELVRYGIYAPDDPLIVDSVKVIDKMLKVDTPMGPSWHRYNHDGYGQKDDGSPFTGWGRGRAWPLLTGERAHYELALGNDVESYINAMEKFAGPTHLLPEQVWDTSDLKEGYMYFGRATGSARPLAWAHAEYLKLLRSVKDGRVFDLIEPVAERYIRNRGTVSQIEIWKFSRMIREVPAGKTLRIQSPDNFTLHWSDDSWSTVQDTSPFGIPVGMYYVDIDTGKLSGKSIIFTFHWAEADKWEGRNFEVSVL